MAIKSTHNWHKFVGEGDIYFFVVRVVAKTLHLSVFKFEAFLRRTVLAPASAGHVANGKNIIYLLLDHYVLRSETKC